MFEIGMTVKVLDAANLPCEPGDVGVVEMIRQQARDFPIGVRLHGAIEWFRESELEPVA